MSLESRVVYSVPTHLQEREPFAFGRTVGEIAKLVAIGFVAARLHLPWCVTCIMPINSHSSRGASNSAHSAGEWEAKKHLAQPPGKPGVMCLTLAA